MLIIRLEDNSSVWPRQAKYGDRVRHVDRSVGGNCPWRKDHSHERAYRILEERCNCCQRIVPTFSEQSEP